MSGKKNTSKEIVLSDEEKALIQQERSNQELIQKTAEDIGKLLKERGLRLIVNQNSPIGNPQIIIVK